MRGGLTEAPFSGAFCEHRERGCYLCAHCGQTLLFSQYRFHSGRGRPSFLQGPQHVVLRADLDPSIGLNSSPRELAEELGFDL